MTDYMKEAERLLDEVERMVRGHEHDTQWAARLYNARTALLAHIQRGVPEGYVAVPRFLAENHRNLTDVPRYQRILDDCLAAAAPDHFRDDAGMVAELADDRIAAAIHYPECWDTAAYPTVESALAEVFAHYRCTEHDAPAEVPMPEPGVSTYEGYRDSTGEWHAMAYSTDQMRNYGAACRADGEAAGYVRGLADERERCASVAWAHYMDTCRRKGIGPDVLPDWCCAAALRGEVKP